MGKTIKYFLFMFFVLFLNSNALAYENTIDIGKTNIDVSFNYNEKNDEVKEILYTIPENFNEDEVIINAGSDINNIMNDKLYMPGYRESFTITIKNNSSKKYIYQNKSFYVSTEKLSNYNPVLLNTFDNKYVTTFDNNLLPKAYTTHRTANLAIQSLYNKNSSYIVSNKLLSDSNLDKILKENNYNGINELDKYFLDYYNKYFNKNNKSIFEFNDKEIASIFSGNVDTKTYETNYDLAKLGYDYFYNHLFSLIKEGENINSNNYTIGNIMSNYNQNIETPFENDFINSFNNIENDSYSAVPLKIDINGPDTTNAYQNYNFGFTLGFKLISQDQTYNTVMTSINKKNNEVKIKSNYIEKIPKTGINKFNIIDFILKMINK